MKTQTGAGDYPINVSVQGIGDWLTSAIGQISEFLKRYLEGYRLERAQTHYRTVRELQQKAEFEKGTIDALPIEEKLKLGIYRF